MKHQTFTYILIISFFFNSMTSAQWENLGAGISEGQRKFFSLSVIDENIIWAVPIRTTFAASYIYTKTTDGGMTWEEGSFPDTIGNYYPTNIFALNENMAWIVMVNIPEQHDCRIFKTADGGTTWVEQAGEFNDTGHTFATLHFFNENEGVGFGSPGTSNPAIDSLQIFRTNDGGDNWNRIPPNDLPAPLDGEGIWAYSGNNSYEVKGDTIWFVTRASRVFRSIDKGVSWNAFDVGISGNTIYPGLSSIAFENSLNGIAVTYQPNKAARTQDGGETWTQIPIPSSPRIGAIEYIPGTENTYLTNDAFGTSSSMLLTTDGGTTWETVSNPPSLDCMYFISPTIGFGGGDINPTNDVGFYKWIGDLSDTMTTRTNDFFLDSSILNLYPNPTSEKLILSFNKKTFGTNLLNIRISSIAGRIIRMEEYDNTGEIEISIQTLPKGIYNIQVSNKEKNVTKRFIKE